jgi:hypothetical protein
VKKPKRTPTHVIAERILQREKDFQQRKDNTPSPETRELLSKPPQWTEEHLGIIDQSLKEAAEKIKSALRKPDED